MVDAAETVDDSKPPPTNGGGVVFKLRLLWSIVVLSGLGTMGVLFQTVLSDSKERDRQALEESVRARNEVIMFRQEMKDEIARVRVEFGAQHQLIFDRLGKLDARMDTLARSK